MGEVDVSLVITNYNRAEYLERSIRSCQDQVVFRRDFEVIVVDDCSTDHSRKIIERNMPGTKAVLLSKNRGVAGASNAGLAESAGRYFIRVDADDFLDKLAITHMAQVLDENPHIDFVYADHFRVDDIGYKQERVSLADRRQLFAHGAGVLFRTDVLRRHGGYDESLRNCEDYDLFGRLLTKGSMGFHLPLALYRYHIHGENMTLQDDRLDAVAKMEKKYAALLNR